MPGKPQEARMDIYRRIAISFFVASLFLLMVVFYISFSWATAILTPRPTAIAQTYAFEGQQKGASLGDHQIPIRIHQKDLEGEGSFPASRQEPSPLEQKKTEPTRTSGTLTVANTTTKAQVLRKTTRFISPDGILFRSQALVTVPPGGQIPVPVIADKEGDLGEINDLRFTLPGLWPGLQDKIYGMNFVMRSGTNAPRGVVTREDVQKGVEAVSKRLEEKMKTLLSAGTELSGISQPRTDIDIHVVSVTTDQPVGTEGDQFTIRLKVKATAVSYAISDLQKALKEKLGTSVGPGYEIIPPKLEDITTTVEDVDKVSGSARIKTVFLAGKIRTADASNFDKTQLTGKSASDIEGYFQGFEDITDAEVRFYPFWVTRAPFLVDHITILIKKE